MPYGRKLTSLTEETVMQANLLQAAMQPYIRLVQANMELLAKFSLLPDVIAQAAAGAQSLLQQGKDAGGSLMQSGAFAQLVQGMLKRLRRAPDRRRTNRDDDAGPGAGRHDPPDAAGFRTGRRRLADRQARQASGCVKAFPGADDLDLDLDNLPTLEQIRSQRLLTPLQLLEMEDWFRRSCLLGTPLEMSLDLVRALNGLRVLASIGPDATMH